ncbi:unnamed protein product [Absidia cylindrospora]
MKAIWLFLSSLLYTAIMVVAGTAFQLQPTFRSSKNIVFGAFIPGSSHTAWVLQFLDELAARGHNTTFVTLDGNLKFGAPYPRITTIPTGVKELNEDLMNDALSSHSDPLLLLPQLAAVLGPIWTPCYETLIDYMDKNKVDVIICDHVSDACSDAAATKNVPMILTSTTAVYPDAATAYMNNNMINMDDFTTVHQSIYLRLYNNFVAPFRLLSIMTPELKKMAQIKQNAGMVHVRYTDNPDAKTKHALKIVNSLFGLETPRPLGPLVELVGPLMSTEYSGLDEPFESYLSTHQRVVYVAFGQHARPMTADVELILNGLIQQYEKGHIDGIIWSSKTALPEIFPKTITSAYSGKTYDLAPLFDSTHVAKNGGLVDDIYAVKWSPQMGVLQHPSVLAFISHGGANSITEALYAGKKLIFYPFFGDQIGNALILTRSGVSEHLSHLMDRVEVAERMERIILDKEGNYQRNIQRYQALIQINSKGAPSRAADIVEEVAFTNVNGKIPQREDVGQLIGFLKRYNLDIFGIALLVAASIVSLVVFGFYKLVFALYYRQQLQQKTKTL